ncbi:MAG TPA: PKD domain-containing protein [Candidatus Krumholzibacteria bacterium]|nr:PKD domain-containing protein [Candidatus Krumholzibacteria bacterium]
MHGPRRFSLHFNTRRALLAASLIFLACGEDGDDYAPLGNGETPQATVVAGLVRDQDRSAVADAVVVIEPANEGIPASADFLSKNPDAASASTPGRRVTTTNDHGRFAFEDVEAGEYYLQVIADDHLGGMQSVRVPDRMAFVDTVYVDVNLTPTGTFSGVAALENAAIHQGTVVYVEGTSYVAVTDPTGDYAITNVPVGSYTVRAEHAGYLEDTESGTITTAGENVSLAGMLLRINSNIPPVANVGNATPLFEDIPVNFTGSGSDADGTIARYEWDFEDDGTFDYSSLTTASTSHVYPEPGAYRAKLRVTDDDGGIGLDVIELDIVPNDPTVVYMSPSGSDGNDGTIATPVLTLARAYQVAQQTAKTVILAREGTYNGQVPAFLPGIDVMGGRTPQWDESPSGYSTFNFTLNRALANNITTPTLIRRVSLYMSQPATGTNSIALYSVGSDADLQFQDCRFDVDGALSGNSGANGTTGANASSGFTGQAGSCDGARGLGGAGGASPGGCPGGAGGAGGVEGPNDGFPGIAGACTGGAGGVGGQGDAGSGGLTCDAVGGPGGNGSTGAVGISGTDGAAASPNGSIIANEWVPNTSGSGLVGAPGDGGGGGGGGGGQGGTFCNDGGGNGGGGGGGGGSGGTGGTGGVGGRAAFCVMLVNSSPTFDGCTFLRGIGGTGGGGGFGGSGGNGGFGGSGATACLGEVGRGGNGGAGGDGGQGGGGAGGPGGPSYGIYRVGASNPVTIGNTFSGGAGGTGGLGASGAPNGPTGLFGTIN